MVGEMAVGKVVEERGAVEAETELESKAQVGKEGSCKMEEGREASTFEI
jgi:hypothetical protein